MIADMADRNVLDLAENYLRQLAPHVAEREGAQIMRELVKELKGALQYGQMWEDAAAERNRAEAELAEAQKRIELYSFVCNTGGADELHAQLAEAKRDGYVLVPKEPTEAMLDAAARWLRSYHHMRAGDKRNAVSEAYKAMLVAMQSEGGQ